MRIRCAGDARGATINTVAAHFRFRTCAAATGSTAPAIGTVVATGDADGVVALLGTAVGFNSTGRPNLAARRTDAIDARAGTTLRPARADEAIVPAIDTDALEAFRGGTAFSMFGTRFVQDTAGGTRAVDADVTAAVVVRGTSGSAIAAISADFVAALARTAIAVRDTSRSIDATVAAHAFETDISAALTVE